MIFFYVIDLWERKVPDFIAQKKVLSLAETEKLLRKKLATNITCDSSDMGRCIDRNRIRVNIQFDKKVLLQIGILILLLLIHFPFSK